MKLDRTLIDKDGAPSENEAREFFLKHSYLKTSPISFNGSK